jgi:hypothetical protein
MIDMARLRKTFKSIPQGVDAYELTLPITSAKELAAAVTCDEELPAIDFATHRAYVLVRTVGPRGDAKIVRSFDNGKTVLFADRTTGGCPGGARQASEPEHVTTIVVVPADRAVDRRTCYVVGPPCSPLAK